MSAWTISFSLLKVVKFIIVAFLLFTFLHWNWNYNILATLLGEVQDSWHLQS